MDTVTDYNAQLGARIANCRIGIGWSQDELGARMGCTQTAVSYWEAGGRAVSVATLLDLARVLDVDPGWLLTGERRDQPRRRSPNMSQADRDQILRGMSVLKAVAEVLERLAGEQP